MSFELRLLGLPHFLKEDAWLALPDNQPLMLAAYLALQEDWVSRDALLALFWPDEADKIARHNLSQLLYQTKQQKWAVGLESDRSRARWQITTDVLAFREALAEGDWQAAVTAYGGTLLESVHTDAFIEFDDWLAHEREELQAAWREAVLKHCAALEARQAYDETLQLLKQVLKQDSLAEDVLQSYLKFAALAGQREQALKVFEGFKEQLQDELALEPLEETLVLVEQLRANHSSSSARAEAKSIHIAVLDDAPERVAPVLTNFPHQLTPFVGRDLELAELSSALKDPDCRHLTIFGPGGMGKSRLAIEFALEHAHLFNEGATFVPLAAISSANYVVSALADALSFAPSAGQALETQVLQFLASQDLLLVIDNFEHVLDASSIILSILEVAPKLRILATSREPLGFQSEWRYELKGMDVPSKPEQIELHGSVQLFLRTARRAVPQFQLQDADKPLLASICQLLSGMPLGIELAAQWVRLLSVQEIADELAQGLEFLETAHRDLPERHRSLKAVFDYSWQLLSSSEQQTLQELSVFQGGFSKDAATSVTSASLRSLLSLVNKSLLSRTQAGRFERLMIVQQFSKEKLEQDSSKQLAIQTAHAAYYLELAQKAEPELVGAQQAQWLKTLSSEHDNLRAALNFYQTQDLNSGLELAGALWYFWYMRNDLSEGRSYLKHFLNLKKDATQARAKALRGAGVLAERQNDLTEAEVFYKESLELNRDLDDEETSASILNNLANLAFRRLDYTKAKALYEESLAIYRKQNVIWRIAIGLSNLGLVAGLQANYKAAESYLQESLALSQEAENTWMIASSLRKLGDLAYHQMNYGLAQEQYEESFRLKQVLNDEEGAASLKSNLASLAFQQQDFVKAEQLLSESLTTMKRLESKNGLATANYHIALLEHAKGNISQAQSLLKGCLEQFERPSGVAKTLEALAIVAVSTKQFKRALTLLSASDALRQQSHLIKTPQEHTWLEPYKLTAEQALTKAVIEEAYNLGRTMNQAASIRFGLA